MTSDLTSKVTSACKTCLATEDEEEIQKLVSIRKGIYISREDGVELSHELQIAVLNLTTPIVINEHSAENLSVLFASVYNQWEWWRDRFEFTSPDQISMGQSGRSSLLFVQALINGLENSLRKAIGRKLSIYLDTEIIENFARSQIFEWMSNKTQDPWRGQTNQGSTNDLNRFPNQFSSQESRNSILVEKPIPPSASELNNKSASEMITYLRAVETNHLQPEWSLLHNHLDSEMTWSWNTRPDDLKISAPGEYQKATNLQLIQWLENLYAKDTHKPKKVRFLEYIEVNPLMFDPYRDINLQEGSFGRLLRVLNNQWRIICKYQTEKPNAMEE